MSVNTKILEEGMYGIFFSHRLAQISLIELTVTKTLGRGKKFILTVNTTSNIHPFLYFWFTRFECGGRTCRAILKK